MLPHRTGRRTAAALISALALVGAAVTGLTAGPAYAADLPTSMAMFGTPTIDGTQESVWSASPDIHVAGSDPATGDFHIMWDDDNLYVLADIADGTSSPAYDDLAVWINWNNDPAATYRDATASGYTFARNGTVRPAYPTYPTDTSVVNYKTVSTDSGYVIEAAIPWPKSVVTSLDAHQIGINFSIDDDWNNDGARDNYNTWESVNAYWDHPAQLPPVALLKVDDDDPYALSVVDGGVITGTSTVFGVAQDAAASLSLQLDGATVSSGTGSLTYDVDANALPEGTHTFALLEGTVTKKSASFTVDYTAPTVTPSITDGTSVSTTDKITIDAKMIDPAPGSGIAQTEVALDGNDVALGSQSTLTAGHHLISFTATDQAGNTTTKLVNITATAPAITVNGATSKWSGKNAALSITPSIPGGKPADVSFFSSKAKPLGNVKGYDNVVGSTVITAEKSTGEKPLGAKKDGYVTTSSPTGMPYQAYDVATNGAAGNIELDFTGHTQGDEKLALAVWNVDSKKWEKVASGSGADGSDFTLHAAVPATHHVSGGKLRAMILPDLVSNGSDSVGWFSDPQFYTDAQMYAPSTIGTHIFNSITQYFADQYKAGKIGYVLNTGDIVNIADTDSQWNVADAAVNILDASGVPYGLLPGDHDVGTNPYYYYNEYFPASRFAVQPSYGAGPSGYENQDHYDLVTVGGKDLLMLYIGDGVESTPQTVAWANKVLSEYRDRSAIVLTHAFLDYDNTHINAADAIFNQIIAPNDNVVMMLCGHNTVARTTETVPGTDRVIQEIQGDFQDFPVGGDGYLRTMRFTDDKMITTSYSPVTGGDGTDAGGYDANNFTVPLTLRDPNRTISTASFTASALGDKVGETQTPSGTTAAVDWKKPAASETGWYAIVSGGGQSLSTANYTLAPRSTTASTSATPPSAKG